MRKISFTLAETLIVVVIMGIIGTCIVSAIKKGDYQTETLKKAGKNYYLQINIASKQILAKYSYAYNMTALLSASGTGFSITDNGSNEKLAALFKKILGVKEYTPSSEYYTSALYDEESTAVGESISSFTHGFLTINGTYMAFKINNNCTTSETHIYDPSMPDSHNALRSCGLIFYDVNAEEKPNILGIDQYILSIHKNGIN